MRREIVNDWPENYCFGCSPFNERGLKLVFVQTGEQTVECSYTAADHLEGAPGIVHGGIQATLLDEVMGTAVRTLCPHEQPIVTAEFALRYRRPARVGEPLTLRAAIERAEDPQYHVTGEILDASGELLTRATARWVRL